MRAEQVVNIVCLIIGAFSGAIIIYLDRRLNR